MHIYSFSTTLQRMQLTYKFSEPPLRVDIDHKEIYLAEKMVTPSPIKSITARKHACIAHRSFFNIEANESDHKQIRPYAVQSHQRHGKYNIALDNTTRNADFERKLAKKAQRNAMLTQDECAWLAKDTHRHQNDIYAIRLWAMRNVEHSDLTPWPTEHKWRS